MTFTILCFLNTFFNLKYSRLYSVFIIHLFIFIKSLNYSCD